MLRDEADGWLRLGEVAPQMLAGMRLQTLWAAQLVAAVAAAHVRPAADGSHIAMEWISGQELLVGARPFGGRQFRAGLRIAGFAVVLLDMMDRPLEELFLDGRTLSDARSWLENGIASYTESDPVRLQVPAFDIPNHPVAGGRVFSLESGDACVELARWYAGAEVVLRELAAVTPNSSPVRCWPQHLDLRTRITVAAADRPRSDLVILVGMSPGDSTFPEPYWYVAPSTMVSSVTLPALSHGGEWHVGDWTGAVLRARRLLPGSAAGQRERLVVFLNDAITAACDLLGVTAPSAATM
jgi:hypothetical protein